MSKSLLPFVRPQAEELARRLAEPRRWIQVLAGARQVGKTTLAEQVAERLGLPTRYTSADEPTLRDSSWLEEQWEAARVLADDAGKNGALLILDEVQTLPTWSETVKRLWDADTRVRRRLKVVLLGFAPLLIQRGLTESLAGRFEAMVLPHWSFAEMREAFGWSLEQFLYYGVQRPTRPLDRFFPSFLASGSACAFSVLELMDNGILHDDVFVGTCLCENGERLRSPGGESALMSEANARR